MNKLLKNIGVVEAAELLKKGEISSLQLCEYYIERIEKIDKTINAFRYLDKDAALKESIESDKRRKNNKFLSEFDGIPLSVKDLIMVKDQPCTCGSKILNSMKSVYDATVVSRLKNNGFILLGRNNMDEFAMGSSCENSSYGIVRNPWDLERVPGGSSGGSAAAVAADEITASLGSDTGGSVRQPASFCGVVGLKPSYGTVSRYGLVAYASSLDQIGPLTKNVDDAAAIFNIISGHDKMDGTTFNECKPVKLDKNYNLDGLKIGVPVEYIEQDGLDPLIRKSFENRIELFKNAGATIVNVSIPHTKYAIAAYYVIATAEASANLARFDGVRYGRRSENISDLESLYLKTRGEFFGDEVKRRILLGTFVLSSGYYDAYYLKAQKVRTLLCNDFKHVFRECDVIATPISPVLPFKIGEIKDSVQMYLADIYTISANMAGLCGISVPSDIISGLPVGLQLLGAPKQEELMLNVGAFLEKNRGITDILNKMSFIEN